MKTVQNTIPISLYIHTPWCIKKCPYCDFNSHALKGALPETSYIEALITDFREQLPLLQGRTIQSIFIGGGTPSLLTPESYDKLFQALRKMATISKDAEITMEANPGTVEQQRFLGYRQLGINRISIGIQSLQDDKLKTLGRIHNATEALKAIETAKAAGFSNFNIDLMFGLPQQSVEDGLYDLRTAIDCHPSHLSWYQLTLEPNTYFDKFPPTLPDDDAIGSLQTEGQKLLAEHAYQQYEVSAYSQENKQCRHNLNYWEFGDYLGIGAGAHGKITDFNNQQVMRRWNVKNPKDYLNTEKGFMENQTIVSAKELPLEFMMNALRLQKSVSLDLFIHRTGLNTDILQPAIKSASEANLLEVRDAAIHLSESGHRYLNDVLNYF